jgi:hypothetical protein
MKKLDGRTVKAVELTAPGFCSRDAGRLYRDLKDGHIFGAFTEQEREAIWGELLAVSTDRLIPSLFTFFEDVRYLRGLAECVKRLMGTKADDYASPTLKHRFSSESLKKDICMFQLSDSVLEERLGNADDQLDMGYRQVWMSLMRENGGMLAKSCVLAHKLGFRTAEMKELVQHSAHQVDGPAPKIPYLDKPPKRCGIPRAQDQQHDKALLFADKLHRDVDRSAGVTSFFVRRSVYLAFFGRPRHTGTDCMVMGQVLIGQTEQTELAQLAHDLEEERRKLDQRTRDLDAQEEANKVEKERLKEESQKLKEQENLQAQQADNQATWSEQQRKKQKTLEAQATALDARDQANKAEKERLEEESQKLKGQKDANEAKERELQQKQEELRRQEQNLQVQQTSNEATWSEQQRKNQKTLEAQATALDARDKANKAEKERLEAQATALDAQDKANKVEKERLEEESQKLKEQEKLQTEQANNQATWSEQQRVEQNKRAKALDTQEEANKAEKERLEEESQKLLDVANKLAARKIRLQKDRDKLKKAQDKLTKAQEKLDEHEQGGQASQQQLGHEPQSLVAEADQLAQEYQQEQHQQEQHQQEQHQQERHQQEQHQQEQHQQEQHQQEQHQQEQHQQEQHQQEQHQQESDQGRRITQIVVEQDDSTEYVGRDTPVQSPQESQTPEEQKPELEDLTGRTHDEHQGAQENSGAPQRNGRKPPQAEQGTNRVQAKRLLAYEPSYEDGPSYARKKPKLKASENNAKHEFMPPPDITESLPEAPTSSADDRRTTQIMVIDEPSVPEDFPGLQNLQPPPQLKRRNRRQTESPDLSPDLPQRKEPAADQPAQQEPSGNVEAATFDQEQTASQVCVEFRIINGESSTLDKKVLASPENPEPVREAAQAYHERHMKLYDSGGRILSVETCLEDVIKDKTPTIYLRR